MKKKLLAGILAAAMLTGLASATFAVDKTVDSTRVSLTAPESIEVEAGKTANIKEQVQVSAANLVNADSTVTPTVTYAIQGGTGLTVGETDGVVTATKNATGPAKVTVTATAQRQGGTQAATVTAEVTVTVKPATTTPTEPTKKTITITSPTGNTVAPGTTTFTASIDGKDETAALNWGIGGTTHPEGISFSGNVLTVASTVADGTKFTVVVSSTAVNVEDLTQEYTVKVQSTTTGGGSTSSGGGSSSGSTTTTTTPAEETVGTTEAVAKTEQAIEAAVKADPDVVVVVVKVKNAKSITAAALKAVAKAAEKAEKTPVIHADVVKDGKVESRLYIDPSLVKGNGEIKLGVTLGDEKVSTKFDKYFKNDIAVVKFDQAGSFGMNIKAAVKLDLSKLDTKNLVFYSYDPKTNRYTKMSVKDYRIDKNGYLHFTTSVGNCVLVTDEPLARK